MRGRHGGRPGRPCVSPVEVYCPLERRLENPEARKHPGQQRGRREVSKQVVELEARRCATRMDCLAALFAGIAGIRGPGNDQTGPNW